MRDTAHVQHGLDLLGNAIDSLNEGLRQYESAKGANIRSYKFAVLHFAHALELLLKYGVAKQHPLLVYRNPATTRIANEQTIGLSEAIAILTNAGITLEKRLVDDLTWLKRLRNQIEHYSFSMDVGEVRATLGRIIRASQTLATAAGIKDLRGRIDRDCEYTYERLLDAYDERLAAAAQAAFEEMQSQDLLFCGICGEPTAVPRDNLIHCHFCGHDDHIDECVICGENNPRSQLITWNDDDPARSHTSARHVSTV